MTIHPPTTTPHHPYYLILLIQKTSVPLAKTTQATYWGDTIVVHCPPAKLHRVYFQNLYGLRNDSEARN